MSARHLLAAVIAATLLAPITLPAQGRLRRRADAPAGLVARTVTVGGTTRRYVIHVPAQVRPGTPVPVLVFFHGFGGTGTDAATRLGFLPLADRDGFVAVFPDGERRRWRDGYIVRTEPGVDDVAFVRALLDDVARQVTIDRRRIFAAGHSNGAIFSELLPCRLPGVFAAIAPVSGQLSSGGAASCAGGPPVSMVEIHGTADGTVPYAGGPFQRDALLSADSSAAWRARQAGCRQAPRAEALPDVDPNDGTTVRRLTWEGCAGGRSVVLYQVVDGGHGFPGVPRATRLRAGKAGPTTQDISGAAVIWEFFRTLNAEH